MKKKMMIVNDDLKDPLSIMLLKTKFALSPASLESQQANLHANGGFTKEVSKVLRISLALSYRLVVEGNLPGVLFCRTFGVRLENLDRFIAEIYQILIHPDPFQLILYNHDLLSRNLQLEK